ncbi:hypothetical protein LguiA_016295 [Lonicera macranthoides]
MACHVNIYHLLWCHSNSLVSLPLHHNPFPSSSSSSSSSSKTISYSTGRRLSALSVVKSQTTAAAKKPISQDRMLVFVPPHPLIKHWVSVLRNEHTPPPIFKNAMAELGRLLMYEASRDWLPTITGEIQSPMGVADVEFIDPREPVAIVPILRAGLVLAENASSVLPATKTYHLVIDSHFLLYKLKGLAEMRRHFCHWLPEFFSEGTQVFVVDPMLATGGTIVAALDLIKARGVDNKQIKVVSAVAAPPALQKLSEKFPGLHVYAGIIDPTVNEQGFIIPGLGDAGDRSFNSIQSWEPIADAQFEAAISNNYNLNMEHQRAVCLLHQHFPEVFDILVLLYGLQALAPGPQGNPIYMLLYVCSMASCLSFV